MSNLRLPILIGLALAGVFAATAQAQNRVPRPSQLPAQPPPAPTAAPVQDLEAITVPDTGLRFRRKDGRMVARLNTDGTLDLFDAQGQKRTVAESTKISEIETRLRQVEGRPAGARCTALTTVKEFKRNAGYDDFRICMID
jgi:hypothetical protein